MIELMILGLSYTNVLGTITRLSASAGTVGVGCTTGTVGGGGGIGVADGGGGIDVGIGVGRGGGGVNVGTGVGGGGVDVGATVAVGTGRVDVGGAVADGSGESVGSSVSVAVGSARRVGAGDDVAVGASGCEVTPRVADISGEAISIAATGAVGITTVPGSLARRLRTHTAPKLSPNSTSMTTPISAVITVSFGVPSCRMIFLSWDTPAPPPYLVSSSTGPITV